MNPKLIIELAQEAPGVVLIFICWFVYRELKKHGESIESIKKNVVSKEEMEEVKEDIENMKERVVWKDVCQTVRDGIDIALDAIKDRVKRLEELANGRLKS